MLAMNSKLFLFLHAALVQWFGIGADRRPEVKTPEARGTRFLQVRMKIRVSSLPHNRRLIVKSLKCVSTCARSTEEDGVSQIRNQISLITHT